MVVVKKTIPDPIVAFDFNAQVKDTIDDYWVVTNIETVEILGVERKKIDLETCAGYQEEWIEGIGNMTDLLAYSSRPSCGFNGGMVGMTTFASRYRLNCVEEAGNLLFKNTASNDCWMYKGYNPIE